MTTHHARKMLRLLLRGICLLSCLAFCVYAGMTIPRLTHGFATYYTSARIVLEGESFSKAYDVTYFNTKIREYGMDVQDMPNNLPTNALAALPVAWMSAHSARIVWSLLSLGALGLALKFLFELYCIPLGSILGLALLTVAFLWRPAYENVAYGQIYFFLLLLLVLSMKGLTRNRPGETAFPLALTLMLKGYGAVPLFLLAVKKEWKTVGHVALWLLLIIAATLPILGLQSWFTFNSSVLQTLGRSAPDAHVAYQTINSLVRHLFTFDAQWLPCPLLVLPSALVTALSYLANLAVILLMVIPLRFGYHREKLISFGAAIAVGVVTAPLAEEYHFVLFLPLLVGLGAQYAATVDTDEGKKIHHLIAAAALLLLVVPLNYKALQSAPFPNILLGYPKLYAGLTLLWYTRRVLKRKAREEHDISMAAAKEVGSPLPPGGV